MSFAVVIPARYGSTRLPGKPLLDIAGKPMVQRVWEQARASGAAQVIVATDDARIEAVAREFGADVCMTEPTHPSGTDRLQEVASQCGWDDERIVVNVQGDEPLIPPALIEQVATNLEMNTAASIATLSEPVTELAELTNPNAVKVVTDCRGMALYFSRASIPWPREAFSADKTVMPEGQWFRHIGIYAYRVGFLRRYVTWPPAHLEVCEQLEQLRALYNGERIHVAPASVPVPAGVDTAEDLELVRARLEKLP
ncbi:3-deoxy-manno-octulosonate cytidylyltransferase [Pseudohalioglobus lutimaris]|uniref:3-deoxy-manno-octulosonate cytidylyltransferase n=1 Tax=Pseudohalioglobus lutimaris TaxID=1737061 RepID=A0A2N5X4V4_9GAMM|nr:3-deoxy-manno-octulosonate cytidylyltransferase [Pseudohalioglobus lutimaris]PLW69511.1 3-deoxy-manno-octulosonate cytidylyltransferase [Pseudohalioglobus lutimaris]